MMVLLALSFLLLLLFLFSFFFLFFFAEVITPHCLSFGSARLAVTTHYPKLAQR